MGETSNTCEKGISEPLSSMEQRCLRLQQLEPQNSNFSISPPHWHKGSVAIIATVVIVVIVTTITVLTSPMPQPLGSSVLVDAQPPIAESLLVVPESLRMAAIWGS